MTDQEEDPFEWYEAQKRDLDKSRTRREEKSKRRKAVAASMLRDIVSQAIGTALGAGLVIGAGAVFGLLGNLSIFSRIALALGIVSFGGGVALAAFLTRGLSPEGFAQAALEEEAALRLWRRERKRRAEDASPEPTED